MCSVHSDKRPLPRTLPPLCVIASLLLAPAVSAGNSAAPIAPEFLPLPLLRTAPLALEPLAPRTSPAAIVPRELPDKPRPKPEVLERIAANVWILPVAAVMNSSPQQGSSPQQQNPPQQAPPPPDPNNPPAAAPPKPHRFWDKQNAWLFAGVAAARALDYHSTGNMRRRGLNEGLLNNETVDNKPVFATIEAAGAITSVGLSYLFHRTNHHKLERWVSYLHIGIGTFGGVRNYCLKTPHAPAALP